MLKIATVVGARPQFVKAAVVSQKLQAHPQVEEILVHTGQHYDANMSQVFFAELQIRPPDYNLDVGSGTHGAQTGAMLEKLEAVFLDLEPDWVLVYGDTNSTLAGALAAAKLDIPVAHVEAGLRSFNRKMPEEINRVLTDHICEILFVPTSTAAQNLRHEGIDPAKIHAVGDVMYDAARFYGALAERNSVVVRQLGLTERQYILATIHRPYNVDDPERLQIILDGLERVAQQMPVVLPLHPRTRAALAASDLLARYTKTLRLIDPVGYLDMIRLEKAARLIATDSGGVQKEAYFHRVPCVTLRDETEWVELIEAGFNRLCPPVSVEAVVESIFSQMDTPVSADSQIYGDGDASAKIVRALMQSL
jgi:UDP-GlcNAc3NAcA epimerase